MAMTIDNLRLDHQVTVLRDFTDSTGINVRAGATGIVRGLSFDQVSQQICITIAGLAGQAAASISLWFPLMADNGPRNGHMQEYFQVGACVAEKVASPRRPLLQDATRVPDGGERLEDLESAMLKAIPHIGASAAIAHMYAERMRAFQREGQDVRAIAVFKLAVDWMATYASQATSGGEGTALSRESRQFHAALVREFGYDPTLANEATFPSKPVEDNSR